MKISKSVAAAITAVLLSVAPYAPAAVVYQTGASTGFYTPFSSSTPAGTKFGESGWFGTGSSPAVALTEITLGLTTSTTTSVSAGTTDLVFTLNNGDPSGQVFGNGATLYSTTISNVVLPGSDAGFPSNFEVTVPLPSVLTAGGFNNIGWSVAVQNFNYAGNFGFQNRGGNNTLGFYTNNATQYNPGSGTWSQFAFGPNAPADIANFVATISTPEPASLMSIASLGMLLKRRRPI
jgi:hypothetical protein